MLSLERRKVLELAVRYQTLVVEDDPVTICADKRLHD